MIECPSRILHKKREFISVINNIIYDDKYWLLCYCSCGAKFIWRSNYEWATYTEVEHD